MLVLNQAMRLYQHIDVVPVYQSAVIVNHLVCGLILLNEQAFYSWG